MKDQPFIWGMPSLLCSFGYLDFRLYFSIDFSRYAGAIERNPEDYDALYNWALVLQVRLTVLFFSLDIEV